MAVPEKNTAIAKRAVCIFMYSVRVKWVSVDNTSPRLEKYTAATMYFASFRPFTLIRGMQMARKKAKI